MVTNEKRFQNTMQTHCRDLQALTFEQEVDKIIGLELALQDLS